MDDSRLSFLVQPFVSDFWSTLESIVTIAAIVIGGVWTYNLFVRRRASRPRLNLEISVATSPGPNSTRLLQIRVDLHNIGEVLITLGDVTTWVQQISPISDEVLDSLRAHDPLDDSAEREIPWPRVASRVFAFSAGDAEIEPGEPDEITYDFLIPDYITEIQVYAYLKNAAKSEREIGWGRTLRYALPALARSAADTPMVLLPSEVREMSKRVGTTERIEKQQSLKPAPEKAQQPPKTTPPTPKPGKKE